MQILAEPMAANSKLAFLTAMAVSMIVAGMDSTSLIYDLKIDRF